MLEMEEDFVVGEEEAWPMVFGLVTSTALKAEKPIVADDQVPRSACFLLEIHQASKPPKPAVAAASHRGSSTSSFQSESPTN